MKVMKAMKAMKAETILDTILLLCLASCSVFICSTDWVYLTRIIHAGTLMQSLGMIQYIGPDGVYLLYFLWRQIEAVLLRDYM